MSTEAVKEALTQMGEDFVSAFQKHQQDDYYTYRRTLELVQQAKDRGERISPTAMAKELRYPPRTVNGWINEKHFPLIEREIRELKELGLYPLTPNNPHLPFLARSSACLMGDGHLHRNLKRIYFFDESKESLENLKTGYKARFPKLSISDVKKSLTRACIV